MPELGPNSGGILYELRSVLPTEILSLQDQLKVVQTALNGLTLRSLMSKYYPSIRQGT